MATLDKDETIFIVRRNFISRKEAICYEGESCEKETEDEKEKVRFRKRGIMKYLRRNLFLVVMVILLFPLVVLAYDNLPTTPEDVGGFVGWFTQNVQTLSGAGALAIVAFVLTCLIGIFKLTPLQKYWDKLGKWKVIIPLVLGAIAELIINFPNPFTWQGLITVIIAGVTGSGALAIAINQVWKNLFKTT